MVPAVQRGLERHPSLIEVSNAEFYKQLIMPPAPSKDRAAEGLILRRVNGAYDRGGKRINMIEAEAVATAVINHARSSETLSLGIVTFSTAQRILRSTPPIIPMASPKST